MFLLVLVEYACFPISSEIVLPFSGAVASLQQIPFLVILPLSVLAGLIGTSICYAIGYFGGTAVLDKIKQRFPKSQKGIDGSYEKFQKNSIYSVCFGRLIPICRTYIAFIAGTTKQKYSVFVISSSLGISLWNFILIGFGYTLRENWEQVELYYSRYKHIFLIVISISLISYGISKFRCKLK